jgi:hypothetical protein
MYADVTDLVQQAEKLRELGSKLINFAAAARQS